MACWAWLSAPWQQVRTQKFDGKSKPASRKRCRTHAAGRRIHAATNMITGVSFLTVNYYICRVVVVAQSGRCCLEECAGLRGAELRCRGRPQQHHVRHL